MKFLVFFILSPLFIAKTNALKCLVCDSIYESTDNVCRLKECDESAKEVFESYEENGSEKLNSEDQTSVNAYYYNITKNTKLSKRNLSEWRNIFDTCISKFGLRDGKPVKLKACGRKEWDSCKNDKDREIFGSCSTCETDYCNTLQCYSCGDRLTDKFSLTPCNNSINQNFCYGDHMRCFSAIDVKSNKTIMFRGCIYNNETEIATEIFKKQAMLYYFCEGNLCNKQPMKTRARTSQNRDNSGKSKSRHKKSTEEEDFENLYLGCMQCKDVAMNDPCKTEYSCSSYLEHNGHNDITVSKKRLYCVSANGTLDGEHQMKYKDCTYEGSGICDELKEKGYDSCSTCDKSLCNAMHCYQCEREEIKEKVLSPCKKVEIQACSFEYKSSAQCVSANTVLNGKEIVWKGCSLKEDQDDLANYFKDWGVSYYFCDKDLCNQNKFETTTSHSNVTEPEEKARSASRRLVLHFPPTAFVIIIMCIYLLF